MYRTVRKPNVNLPDTADFVARLEKVAPAFFIDGVEEIFVARAPGRLDVMGGIADYSGSLVLEKPIREAAFAAVQKRNDSDLKILSESEGKYLLFEMPLSDFFDEDEFIEYAASRRYFQRNADDTWAAYIAGGFLVLMRERGAYFETGANIYLWSDVPQGKGVSSSAAIEAAAMTAAAAAFSIALEPREAAILCQKVENFVVGAPCGIMDQMAVICGHDGQLFSMLCQPAEILKPIKIPDEICFWGIDSGRRHSVGGADYGTVRMGASIGYRIIAELAGLSIGSNGGLSIEDDKWQGFLANIEPAEFEKNLAGKLPLKISGFEFLQNYGGISDLAASVAAERTYAVFHPTAHPIYESARVRKFADLLGGTITESVLRELGSLMYESHESYTACGLGADGTDFLVELVKVIGPERGLFGARVTGGGCGGTVAVLGRQNAGAAVIEVAAEYEKQTGYQPRVFSSSSPGTAHFGILKLEKISSE